MSNKNNSLDKSFDSVLKLVDGLGKNDELAHAAGNVAGGAVGAAGNAFGSVVGLFDNAWQNHQKNKLQKIQNDMQQMNMAHQEKMQKIQNEHDEKMTQERNRHEEAMFKQLCEIFKVAIETASAAYEKKIDFYTAQLNCLENVYSKERDLLSEHIKFLENERRQYINDANKYALISTDISKLEEQKSELYTTYLKSQGNLEDAIKCLEIDQSFNRNLNEIKNNLIGRT